MVTGKIKILGYVRTASGIIIDRSPHKSTANHYSLKGCHNRYHRVRLEGEDTLAICYGNPSTEAKMPEITGGNPAFIALDRDNAIISGKPGKVHTC